MDGHSFPEGGHLLRESITRCGAQALHPGGESFARGAEQPLALLVRDLARETERGEAGRMEDLIGVGIADAVEQVGIRQRPLERVRLPGQRRSKLLERRGEYIESTGES